MNSVKKHFKKFFSLSLFILVISGCSQQQAIPEENANTISLNSFDYSMITVISFTIIGILFILFTYWGKINETIKFILKNKQVAYIPTLIIIFLIITNIFTSKKNGVTLSIEPDDKEKSCKYYTYSPLSYDKINVRVDTKPILIEYNITPASFVKETKEILFKNSDSQKLLVKIKDGYKEYYYESPSCETTSEPIEIKNSFLWLDMTCLNLNTIKDIRTCIKRSDAQYQMVQKTHCDTSNQNIKTIEHPPMYQWIFPENNSNKATYQYEKIISDSVYSYTETPEEYIILEQTKVSGGDLRKEDSVCELSDELLNEIKIKTNLMRTYNNKEKSVENDKNQEWMVIINEVNKYQKSHYYGIGPLTKKILDRFGIESIKYIPHPTDNESQDKHIENTSNGNLPNSIPMPAPPPVVPKIKAKGHYKGPASLNR